MANHQSAISLSEIKALSEDVMDGTDVYVFVDGEYFKATNVSVDHNVTPGTAVIVIEIED